MGTMAVGRIIVLSALIAQTLSAPSGCIETCDYYQTSYQSRQSSTGHQGHANLLQSGATLDERDYTRPGNWTEHNQYNTDEGHGKVHEERGQYVEGAKKVRYYKKNFTSSYGTSNMNGAGAMESGSQTSDRHDVNQLIPSNQRLESLSTYDQLGATSVTGESGYNRVHDQRTQSSSSSSSSRYDSIRNGRLEDFGEYGGHSQVDQRVSGGDVRTTSDHTRYHNVETAPGNWSRADSYRTDGGHGRVFEEEGQYMTGPKKVRYYRKNYTSSYSTSGVPQTDVDTTRLQDLHSELQQNLHKQLDNFRREFHQSSSTGHATNVGAAHSLTQETIGFHGEDLQTAETDAYKHVPSQSTGSVHHYTADQQHREAFADTRQHVPYVYPSTAAGTYGTENQRTYQSHETYVSRMHPAPQPTPRLPTGYIQLPATSGGYQASVHNAHYGTHERHMAEEIQQAEIAAARHSSVAQNQLFTENSRHASYHQPDHGAHHPDSRRGHTTHHEEHWSSSSSSHADGNLTPERGSTTFAHGTHGRSHYDRDAYNEQRGRYHSAAHGYNSHAHNSESNYDPAYTTNTGQLVTGTLDLRQAAQGAADCTEETQQYQQETRYHRKYKRDEHNVQRTAEQEDLTQQNQKSEQESQQRNIIELLQKPQAFHHLVQRNADQLEFGQQTVGEQHLEDLTQQSEQLTQQTEGQLEFGQQTVGDQHLEDLTQQSEQLTQQTEGQLEFGQQTVAHQHLDNLTQQSEQLTQQTEGQLEFGQQTVGDQHLEDLTQQSEQLTQQTEGQLEFGQQTVGHQHSEDRMQQSEQLTQQTEGQLEFGQQAVGNKHLEDLTQQTESQLEFGQQTVDNKHLEDLTQQTEGQIEFGQHPAGHQQMEDLTQQIQQYEQQKPGESDDFMQQTVGKLEFGQQTVENQQRLEHLTQQTEHFAQRTTRSDDLTQQQTVGDHHSEDRMQQSEQLTQQTEGQLEFGQQAVGNKHLEDLTQQTEGQFEFGQQTVGNKHLEDLTQQTEGQLEFGQQNVGNKHLEDLIQQMEGQHEFGQQTVGNKHLEDLTQQTEDQLEFGQQTVGNKHLEDLIQQMEGQHEFGQQTVGNKHLEDLTQQTEGQLEFGQQTVGNKHLEDPTQQTEGQLEFGQQTVGNKHLEDLTQQTEGQLEFGQQTVGNKHLGDLTQQTEGQLEFGQQTVGNKHLEDLTQQMEGQLEFGQQTVGNKHLEDLTQQTEGQLEFGQQTVGNKHLEDLTQQTEGQLEFGQQTVGNKHLEDLIQQMEGQHEFGQQTGGSQNLEDLMQQSEKFAEQTTDSDKFTQQTIGKLEFGQHARSPSKPAKPKNEHLEEFNEHNEDFAQQTAGMDDLTQQTMGKMEFGQYTPHRSNNPKVGNQYMEDFTQQNEDFTQQNEDFTQQNEDFTQQVGRFDDFAQQTAGHLEYGQQRERQQMSNWQKYNGHLEGLPQRNDWNTDDLSQQSHQYPSFNTDDGRMSEWQSEKNHFDHDVPQQTDDQQSMTTGMAKPAAKPKPRQRYPKHDSLPSHIDGTDTRLDDVSKPIEVNPEADIDNLDEVSVQHRDHVTYPELDSKMENLQSGGFVERDMDRLHWLHKSNDATVGLQWHYTYHPSDLTNIENSHDSYYSRHNVNSMSQQTGNDDEQQQQSKPFDHDQQETRGDRAFDDTYQQFVSQSSRTRHNAYDQQSGSFQQVEMPRIDVRQSEQNFEDAPSRVIPLQSGRDSQQTSQLDQQPTQSAGQAKYEVESRILEAYGGGPYDASRDDEIYKRVKPNPSATLPPIGGEDPWDIREKPREMIIPWSVANRLSTTSSAPRVTDAKTAEATETTRQIIAETTTQTVETTTQTVEPITTEETPPSFWSRLGHKITSTYDKAKEKAKEYFG